MSAVSRTCQNCAKSKVRCIRSADNPHVCTRSVTKHRCKVAGSLTAQIVACALENNVSIASLVGASMALKRTGK